MKDHRKVMKDGSNNRGKFSDQTGNDNVNSNCDGDGTANMVLQPKNSPTWQVKKSKRKVEKHRVIWA